MKCEKCGQEVQEDSEWKTLKIEGFEITKPQICKTYEEAKKYQTKKFRLPHRWELFKILEKIENRKKLSAGGYMFFWTDLVEKTGVKGLLLYGDLDLISNSGSLAYSYGNGRVVYVREIKK